MHDEAEILLALVGKLLELVDPGAGDPQRDRIGRMDERQAGDRPHAEREAAGRWRRGKHLPPGRPAILPCHEALPVFSADDMHVGIVPLDRDNVALGDRSQIEGLVGQCDGQLLAPIGFEAQLYDRALVFDRGDARRQ